MPRAVLIYRLPDEEIEHRAALQGRAAKAALWDIDQFCRNLLKHGEPTKAERLFAEDIRRMIPAELLED